MRGISRMIFRSSASSSEAFAWPSAKRLLKAHLSPKGKAAEQEDPGCPNSGVHQVGVAGEDPHKHLGDQHNGQPKHGAVGQCAGEQQPHRFAHPFHVPGAVIEAGDGLRALGEPLQRQVDHLQDAGDDGVGAHGGVPAIAQERGVQYHA